MSAMYLAAAAGRDRARVAAVVYGVGQLGSPSSRSRAPWAQYFHGFTRWLWVLRVRTDTPVAPL
jgi:hypothetical protein